MVKNISKNVFLNSLVCPMLGWLMLSNEEVEALSAKSLAEQFRIEQGVEIGLRAKTLFPEGIDVVSSNLNEAAGITQQNLMNKEIKEIFEATFLIDNYVTRADILIRKNEGWELIEVKSSVNNKPEFIDDIAFTIMVTSKAGINVDEASLLLVSKDFRLGMSNDKLFVTVPVTYEVILRAAEFALYWEEIKKQITVLSKPKAKLNFQCRNCPIFYECQGIDIDNHIFQIPRLSEKKFGLLQELGIIRIEDIPATFELTQNQCIVRDCVKSQKPWVNNQLRKELDSIIWPAFYLDFETFSTAIPLYPDIAPYTQIPTQYSIHKCSDVGNIVMHKEYLSDTSRDCRRELAMRLINDLETKGSIITYSSFEKTTINNLARLYVDLSSSLIKLTERIVDLLSIIQKNFYHPNFHGSTSVKVTLPTLVPDMSYDDLNIADGDTASTIYAYMAQGKYTQKEAETLRKDLLVYCSRDTMAMVKLHERLHEWE